MKNKISIALIISALIGLVFGILIVYYLNIKIKMK